MPNLGDMTKFKEWDDYAIDLLVGGTPCQAFSIAGLRKGLDDPRGNLTLTFLALARRLRPRWVVWENVPGVLSDRSNAFGEFLGGLAELGYGCAYRVLDAQFFGVPQRRRRVFVVGYFGDWHRAAAVLLEPEGLRGDYPARRKKRETVAPTLTRSALDGSSASGGTGRDGLFISEGAPTLSSREKGGGGLGTDFDLDGGLVAHSLRGEGFDASEDGTGRGTPIIPLGFGIDANPHKIARTLTASPHGYRIDAESETLVAGSLQAGGKAAGSATQQDAESGLFIPILEAGARTGKSTSDARAGSGIGESGDPMFTLQAGKQHAIAFDPLQVTSKANRSNPRSDGPCHTIPASKEGPAIAFSSKDFGGDASDQAPTLRAMGHSGSHANAGGKIAIAAEASVRRLTPRECERLQGFPDDWTLIPWRGKLAPDGPRYKALGNSMAVPCMRWIGRRIQILEEALNP